MQVLYRVKSKFYLPQAKSDFEYNWFVYDRPGSLLSGAQLAFTYSQYNLAENELQSTGLKSEGQPQTKFIAPGLLVQLVNELFTVEEALQLKIMLTSVFATAMPDLSVTTSLEAVNLPLTFSSDETPRPLRETYQDGGEFVDPFDFANLEGNTLGFMVGAAIYNYTHYEPADFLNHLSPARLAALRQMHLENNG